MKSKLIELVETHEALLNQELKIYQAQASQIVPTFSTLSPDVNSTEFRSNLTRLALIACIQNIIAQKCDSTDYDMLLADGSETIKTILETVERPEHLRINNDYAYDNKRNNVIKHW